MTLVSRRSLSAAIVCLLLASCNGPRSKEIYLRNQNSADDRKYMKLLIPLENGLPTGTVKTYDSEGHLVSTQNYVAGRVLEKSQAATQRKDQYKNPFTDKKTTKFLELKTFTKL